MEYCINKDLPHPKVIILDSPLTTYKEGDKKDEGETNVITEEVKQSFYRYLSKMKDKAQIIIFDNAEPNDD